MKQLVCIGCPRGCRLTIEEKDGEFIVSGNSCPRGKAFAVSEMTMPKRTISSCASGKRAMPEELSIWRRMDSSPSASLRSALQVVKRSIWRWVNSSSAGSSAQAK